MLTHVSLMTYVQLIQVSPMLTEVERVMCQFSGFFKTHYKALQLHVSIFCLCFVGEVTFLFQ